MVDFSKYQASGAIAHPCSVILDVDSVALLASTVGSDTPVSLSHQVVPGQRVPLVAMGLPGFVMGSVPNFVQLVLGLGAVSKVSGGAVERVSVVVPGDLPLRSRSVESESDNAMNANAARPSVISVQGDDEIPLLVDVRPKESPSTTLSLNAEYPSVGASSVVAESRNVYKQRVRSVIHVYQYTSRERFDMSTSDTVGVR